MTNESKRKSDEKLWRQFLEIYIERLQKEVDGDAETLDTTRRRIMKQNNPRCVENADPCRTSTLLISFLE